jgi:RNA polymerase sigma-70 factor, ECF subfamily
MVMKSAAPESTTLTDDAPIDVNFARLIEQEIPFLRRVVRRWHREPADAEDLVQDTLVRALANAHLWQPGTNLRAWLAVIMRNHFFQGVTKSNLAASAISLYACHDSVEDGSESRLVLRDVADALGRLSQRQRQALLRVGVDGQSYKDVAKAMGVTAGAIRCDLARARERLRSAVYLASDRSPCAAARPARRRAARRIELQAAS